MERARRWPSARGKILESIQFKRPGEKGTHFRVRYEFEVGERIESDTARASGDWFWGDKQQTAFVARYVPGADVEVFYNPRNPKENCLDHSDASGITAMWLLAAGGTVLATGLVLLRWAHRRGSFVAPPWRRAPAA